MTTYRQFSEENVPVINQKMYDFIEGASASDELFESMSYSLEAGGKRFRPL